MLSFNRSRLRELRTARGMTPTGLGAAVGVTEAAVRQWESGKRVPRLRLDQALRLTRALGVQLEDLLLDG